MNKPIVIFSAVAVVAIVAVAAYTTNSGLEGRFNDTSSSRRVVDSRNTLPTGNDGAVSIPASDALKYEQYLLTQPTYVTLADLSTEVVKRRLNITSGWGKTTKVYSDLKLTPEMEAKYKDCANGIIDGKFELGEWQYCYLSQDSTFPFVPQTNVDLKGKIKQGDAAKILGASLLNGKISGYSGDLTILDTFADKNYQPNEYLTVELATAWFKNLNKQLQSVVFPNPWNTKGDFSSEEVPYPTPKPY